MHWSIALLAIEIRYVRHVLARFFFFFQAEDGIRDYKVTGVQTCALPISLRLGAPRRWRFATTRAVRSVAIAARIRRQAWPPRRSRWGLCASWISLLNRLDRKSVV